MLCDGRGRRQENGAGSNYLIQHSVGQSNQRLVTHRLACCTSTTTKVFDKVVVITDRVILIVSREVISQFEHAIGVVERIDGGSSQLAEALIGEQARIIISAKFPFIFDKIEELLTATMR